jgi:hypothetical protein
MLERELEDYRVWKAAHRAVRTLKEAGLDEMSEAERDRLIVSVIGGDYLVFREMDERPGLFGYEFGKREWHCYLRQLRNDQERGQALFDSFED